MESILYIEADELTRGVARLRRLAREAGVRVLFEYGRYALVGTPAAIDRVTVAY